MIVDELVTLLGFKVNKAQVSSAMAVMTQLQRTAMGMRNNLFGITVDQQKIEATRRAVNGIIVSAERLRGNMVGMRVSKPQLSAAERAITQIQQKISQLRRGIVGFGINSPQYKEAQKQIRDLKNALDPLKQTVMSVRIRQDSIDKAKRQMDGFKRSVNSVKYALYSIGGGIGAAFAVRGLVHTSDAIQNLRFRISNLPQTVGDAGEALDKMGNRAIAMRTDINAYGKLYARLAGATKSYLTTQEEVLVVTDAITGALILNGASATESASVTLQLSQAFQKGKLDGDEFRTFMEGLSVDVKEKLIASLRDLSGNVNMTMENIFDMSRQGKLSAKDLAIAFQRLAPEIQERMKEMPMTIGQAFIIARNKFALMIDGMNRKSMTVTKIAYRIIGIYEAVEKGIKGLAKAFNGLGNLVRFLALAVAGRYGSKIIAFTYTWIVANGGLAASLTAVGLAIRRLLLFGVVITILDDFITYLRGGESIIGKIADKIVYFVDKISNAVEKLRNLLGTDSTSKSDILEKFGISNDKGILSDTSAMGANQNNTGRAGSRVQNNNVNINMSVPEGTPESQRGFLEQSAKKIFSHSYLRGMDLFAP